MRINGRLFDLLHLGIIFKQVSGFLGGERDYSKLQGDTGPLVYPAGFLYIYSAIQHVTGGEVYPAQVIVCTYRDQETVIYPTDLLLFHGCL